MRSASDSVAQRRVTGMAGTIIGKWGIGKRGGLCGGGGASCYIDVTSCYIFEGFSQGFDSSMRRRFKPQRRKGRGGKSREKSLVKFFRSLRSLRLCGSCFCRFAVKWSAVRALPENSFGARDSGEAG